MADEQEIQVLRFEEMASVADRIDEEAGVIYGVRIVGMKSLRPGDEADYTMEAHRGAAQRFEGMAVAVDHDRSMGPISVKRTLGVLKDVGVDDGGPKGNLHYLRTHPDAPAMIEDAKRKLGLFSLSMVANAFQRGKTIARYIPERVDLVLRGATTRTLWNQSGSAAAPEDTVPKADFDSLKLRFEQLEGRYTELDKRIKLKETMTASTVDVPPPAPPAVAGFDPKKFWND